MAIIKRTWVKTVNAFPRIAAIFTSINAAGLIAHIALLLHRIGTLAAEIAGERTFVVTTAFAKGEFHPQFLLPALELHRHFIIRLVSADGDDKSIVTFHFFLVHLQNNIASLDTRLG